MKTRKKSKLRLRLRRKSAVHARDSGYYKRRPGYVVAYRRPALAWSATDDTSILEWLTVAEGKAKAEK